MKIFHIQGRFRFLDIYVTAEKKDKILEYYNPKDFDIREIKAVPIEDIKHLLQKEKALL